MTQTQHSAATDCQPGMLTLAGMLALSSAEARGQPAAEILWGDTRESSGREAAALGPAHRERGVPDFLALLEGVGALGQQVVGAREHRRLLPAGPAK